MLGLLGNVAEVKELRPQLMTSQFISVFRLVLLSLFALATRMLRALVSAHCNNCSVIIVAFTL